jgi:hypothetical protein
MVVYRMKRSCNFKPFSFYVCLFFLGIWNHGLGFQANIEPNIREEIFMAARDVKEVMEAHAAELMAIPGVVGVYTGVLDDGTPCIKVMVENRTLELEQKIPQNLQGVPVVIEETGEIRPLSDTQG